MGPQVYKFENFTIIIFSETMASKLSNDVPTMLRTFLEQILHFGEVWSRPSKHAILHDFGQF